MSRFKSDSGRCIPVNENAFKFRDKWLKDCFPIRWKKEHEPDTESIHMNKAAEKGFEVGYFEAKKSYNWIFNDDFTLAYYEPDSKPLEETWSVQFITVGDCPDSDCWIAQGMNGSNRVYSGSFNEMNIAMKFLVDAYKEHRNG